MPVSSDAFRRALREWASGVTIVTSRAGDVVHGMEARWTKGKGPWITARDGDRLYGRGTADNKGQHTLNMAALAAVMSERGGKLGFNAKFMIETGEEAGSKGLKELVRANKDDFAADVLIASDGPRGVPQQQIHFCCRVVRQPAGHFQHPVAPQLRIILPPFYRQIRGQFVEQVERSHTSGDAGYEQDECVR